MLQIIPFTEKYRDDVIKLILDIWAVEFGYPDIARPDIYSVAETYQGDVRSNFWVALMDGEFVGTVALKSHGEEGYLKRLAVAKGFRGRGIGERLLETLLDFARGCEYKTIYAGINPENTFAIKFYEKHGFVKNDFLPEDLRTTNEMICYRLELI